jgi:predicted aspartyl protease
MKIFKALAWFVLAAAVVSTLYAETRCPGNVASVPLRLVNGYQMIVAVSINHSVPYDFLLDTGTQFSMIDPTLAAELHVKAQGSIRVAGTGVQSTASSAPLDYLAIGTHGVANLEAVVYNFQNLRSLNLDVRGIVGEDFLQHFDMLIDNAHRLLCLDELSTMRADVKGQHIALATSSEREDMPPNSLILAVHLSSAERIIRVKLDSGTNASFLYNTSQYMALGLFRGASRHGGGVNGKQQAFMTLPLQNVKIGSLELANVPFVTFAGAQKDLPPSDFDGLITVGLFRRVFICHAEHFAVLEPR